MHCTFSEAIAATRERMKGTSSPSYDNDGRAATAMSHSAKAEAALHVNPGLDRKLQCTSKTRTISSLSASSRDFQVLPPPRTTFYSADVTTTRAIKGGKYTEEERGRRAGGDDEKVFRAAAEEEEANRI